MEKYFSSLEFSREISLLKHQIPELQGITSQEVCKFLISLVKSKFELSVSKIPFKFLKNEKTLKEIIKFTAPKLTRTLNLKIYNHLIANNLIREKKIALSGEILEFLPKTKNHLEISLQKLDMGISSNDNTHVLYPWKIIMENSNEWYRVTDKKYGLKFLHYWYTPDSKDVCVQDSEEFPEPEVGEADVDLLYLRNPVSDNSKIWHVSLNWLLDSIKYQEWMNELDYEIDEQERNSLKQEFLNFSQQDLIAKDEEFIGMDAMLVDEIQFQEDEEMEYASEKEKQGSDASFHGSEEEIESEEDEIEEEDDDDSDFLLEGKEEIPDDKSGSDELNSEALSVSKMASSKPLNIIKELSLYTIVDLERKAPARYKKQGYDPVEDGQMLNISHSVLDVDSFIGNDRKRSSRKWFSQDQELSESDKDIIINILNSSSIFAGFKEIDEIHPVESDAFPSFCGKDATYVNRQVFRDIRNAMILAYATDPYAELTVTECYKHLRYDIHDIATIHNFLSHFHFINTHIIGRSLPRTPFSQDFGIIHESTGSVKNWLYDECKIAQDLSPHPRGHPVLLETCFFCGIDITWRCQYLSRKFSEFALCITCFSDGHFPADMTSRDFVHASEVPKKEIDVAEKVDDTWTDAELLKLLEGIEKYDLSWYNISENVGTKTAQQCLYRFYQYSIDDDLLCNSLCQESKSDSQFWRTIVAQTSNPLMTFLSSACSFCPHMAAVSAKAALNFFGGKFKEKDLDMRALTLQAALVAYDAALDYAKSCIDEESNLIKNNVYHISEKQAERVSLKLKLLEDFTNHQRNLKEPKIPEKQPSI